MGYCFDDFDYMAASKRILAIESSGRYSSVATLQGDADGARLLEQILLSGDERTAQVLAPTIQKLLASAGWSPKSVELVAVALGPGSFTGLRIGVTTAKAFAYAIGAEVMGVNTLESLALGAGPSAAALWAVLSAQRQELFAAKFAINEAGDLNAIQETLIIPQDAWLAGLHAGDRVTGLALKQLVPRLPAGVEVLPEEQWQPAAVEVGQLAWRNYQAGQRDDVWRLSPNYYRLSAAEEKQAG